MKKFRFPLRSVATVRSLKELRARELFSQKVQEYVAAEKRLEALHAHIAELEEILRTGRLERFRPADQASFMAAFKDEIAKVAKAAAETAAARTALEAARQAWLETRRDLRILENLETKARRTHRLEVEREEQAALDDRTNALAARIATTHLS